MSGLLAVTPVIDRGQYDHSMDPKDRIIENLRADVRIKDRKIESLQKSVEIYIQMVKEARAKKGERSVVIEEHPSEWQEAVMNLKEKAA